jgi:hypothetical protein
MKPTVFRYGLYATLAIIGLGAIHFFLLMDVLDYSIQEVLGYLTMLLSMIFVFLGIRHYRDHINNGSLSFGQGMKVGLLIVLIPAVFFGLFDVLFTEVIRPEWKEEYFTHYVEEARQNTPAEKLQARLDALEKQKKLFSNPALQFLFMSITVFIVGAIVTIISSLALRRQKNPD